MLGKFLLKRFSVMLATLFIIVTATFFLMKLLPGTPFNNEEKLTTEQKEQMYRLYGLDKPVYVQYFNFLGNLAQGDLGNSFSISEGRKVTTMIAERFPASLAIGLQALIFGMFGGLILGVISALYRGRFIDNLASIAALIGIAVPSFVMATFLSYYIGVKWGILPTALFEGYEYSILPSLSLSFFVTAILSRYIRTEMVEVLQQDFIKTAKAKGLSKFTIIFKHGLRNALIPAITVLGPIAASILTGTLAIEQIFTIPGMGSLFVDSIKANDYFVITGATLFYSTFIILVMFIIDILYGIIDPRIRITGKER